MHDRGVRKTGVLNWKLKSLWSKKGKANWERRTGAAAEQDSGNTDLLVAENSAFVSKLRVSTVVSIIAFETFGKRRRRHLARTALKALIRTIPGSSHRHSWSRYSSQWQKYKRARPAFPQAVELIRWDIIVSDKGFGNSQHLKDIHQCHRTIRHRRAKYASWARVSVPCNALRPRYSKPSLLYHRAPALPRRTPPIASMSQAAWFLQIRI